MASLSAISFLVLLAMFFTAGHALDDRYGVRPDRPRIPGNQCICTEHLDRVCGSDGTTYANPCLLECEQKKGRFVRLQCRKACPCSVPGRY